MNCYLKSLLPRQTIELTLVKLHLCWITNTEDGTVSLKIIGILQTTGCSEAEITCKTLSNYMWKRK